MVIKETFEMQLMNDILVNAYENGFSGVNRRSVVFLLNEYDNGVCLIIVYNDGVLLLC